MDYLINIYDSSTDTQPKISIENFYDLSIQEDLTSLSSGSLTINKVEGIEQNDIIKIFKISDNDILLFEGYISEISVGIEQLDITFKDYKALFQNKKVLSDKTFTTKTPKEIIDDLIGDYNSYGDSWTCSSSITSTLTQNLYIGDNYYDIINEICDFLQLQWIIKDNVIYVEEFIGDDKTSGTGFFEFIYNKVDITENNITDITRQATPIYNIIIGVDSDGNKSIKTDATSIAENRPLANTINVRSGDLATITQAFVDFYKDEKIYYELESELLSEELNIGDKVAVRIEEAGDYLNFEGNAYIVSKNTIFENNSKFITYNISTNNVKIKSFIQRMRDIDSELNFFAI